MTTLSWFNASRIRLPDLWVLPPFGGFVSYAVFIIGCGMIAGGYDEQSADPDTCLSHAGAVSQHPAFHLAYCVEPDDARRKHFMNRWSIPKGFSCLEEALNSGITFDLAIVCTPTESHAKELDMLIEGPQQIVFCEKPLTDRLSSAEDLVRRYEAVGKCLVVDFNRRWDPAMVALGEQLTAGEYGNLQFAIGHYTKGVLHNGSHMINLMQMLFGSLTIGHVNSKSSNVNERDVPVDATLFSERGAPVYLVAADWRCFDLFELHIVTSLGRVPIIDGGHSIVLQMREPNPRYRGYYRLGGVKTKATDLSRALFLAVDNLAEVLRGHGMPFCDGATALVTQRLCHALRDAALSPAP